VRNIVYYVAASIDGFISGRGEDISGFVADGSGVNQYLQDLQKFDTVIMGRKTYEFGYKFGLQPGQSPYPHMRNYIFSESLQFDTAVENVFISKADIDLVKKLKTESGTDIYLCGGGEFAGWLLDHEVIDFLKIKLNPLILGDGIKLFGNSKKKIHTEVIDIDSYDNGLQIINYKIKYNK
jgi:dihydrofolate reductase